ncbi:MAG: hypothetical protein JWQ96_1511 [Segetibacter sp.]|nr:hypothetical protein [Segetibacter sp.]
MAQKTFSIYAPGSDIVSKNSDSLVVEVGVLHIACVVKRGTKNSIVAVELFNYSSEEGRDFELLFTRIMVISRLLDKSYASTLLFINNPYSVLIPYTRFNKDIAEDYLNMVHGIPVNGQKEFDKVDVEPGIMNAYCVNKDWLAFTARNLMMVTKQHTYTNLITCLFKRADGFPANLLKVQFYPHYLIIVVLKQNELQLVQTFVYETNDDVLYYLLSTAQNLKIDLEDTTLEVSGMIDLQSGLHVELSKYFKNIKEETVDQALLLMNTTEYPSHYFTPFYNLAL